MAGFIFGGNTPWTYEQLQSKRKVAEALASQIGTPRNVGEGLSAVGKALAVRGINRRADKREAELKGEFDQKWAGIFGGMGGGGDAGGGARYSSSGRFVPGKPEPTAADIPGAGNLSFGEPAATDPVARTEAQPKLSFGSATMTPQEMLIAGAEARGLDPIDVATAISYETGGTFDPVIGGPTTQWGQHRGLIQFGQPQAGKYGADFSDPDAAWRSQLDPTAGAVWKYLEDTGVKAGHGLPEVYSAINAGGVGRMGATDAHNGGAPGTVADKVAGMGDHRANAAAFLGGTWVPNEGGGERVSTRGGPDRIMPAGGGQPNIMALAEVAGSPFASPGQRAVAQAMLQQQMQGMDPMRAIEMERAQLELERLRNPQAAFATLAPEEVQALGLPPGVYQRGADGKLAQVADAPKPEGEPASVREYQFYERQEIAKGREPKSYAEWSVMDEKAANPNAGREGADTEELRKKLGGKEGELWAAYLEQGGVAAGTTQDMQLLDELITMAPQGPVAGRLAQAFPGVSSAADAFQSVVKRVAPTLRAPGSGATSDIEYDGMLKSLPQLSSRPEANAAIAGMMKAKAAINMERAAVVREFQNSKISDQEARNRLAEIDSRSIMSPELAALFSGLAPAEDAGATGATGAGLRWRIVE